MQNFENHVRTPTMIIACAVLYLLAIVLAVVSLFTAQVPTAVSVIVASIAGLLTAVSARLYGLSVQDRVVRLEMELRLERVLDGELKDRIHEFTLTQLIALRFASDAELPELARKTFDDGLVKGSEIKRLIKDWQPDHLRV